MITVIASIDQRSHDFKGNVKFTVERQWALPRRLCAKIETRIHVTFQLIWSTAKESLPSAHHKCKVLWGRWQVLSFFYGGGRGGGYCNFCKKWFVWFYFDEKLFLHRVDLLMPFSTDFKQFCAISLSIPSTKLDIFVFDALYLIC